MSPDRQTKDYTEDPDLSPAAQARQAWAVFSGSARFPSTLCVRDLAVGGNSRSPASIALCLTTLTTFRTPGDGRICHPGSQSGLLRDFPALTFLRLCLRLHNVHAGGARTNFYTRARSITPPRILRAVSATREVPSSPSPVHTPAPEVTAVCTKTLFARARHSLARGSHSVRPASLCRCYETTHSRSCVHQGLLARCSVLLPCTDPSPARIYHHLFICAILTRAWAACSPITGTVAKSALAHIFLQDGGPQVCGVCAQERTTGRSRGPRVALLGLPGSVL